MAANLFFENIQIGVGFQWCRFRKKEEVEYAETYKNREASTERT